MDKIDSKLFTLVVTLFLFSLIFPVLWRVTGPVMLFLIGLMVLVGIVRLISIFANTKPKE